MKKILCSTLVVALFSSFTTFEKPEEAECHLFQNAEFTFSCNNTDCSEVTATAPGITLNGDAEMMQLMKTQEGKVMMDNMVKQILGECLKQGLEKAVNTNTK